MPMRTLERRLVPIILSTLACLALSLPASTLAATSQPATRGTAVDIPGTAATTRRAQLDLPARGATMKRVRAHYGAPPKQHAPVGDPPITRWDYPGYSLYFEYNLLLHAVVPGDPEPLVHTDQLQPGN